MLRTYGVPSDEFHKYEVQNNFFCACITCQLLPCTKEDSVTLSTCLDVSATDLVLLDPLGAHSQAPGPMAGAKAVPGSDLSSLPSSFYILSLLERRTLHRAAVIGLCKATCLTCYQSLKLQVQPCMSLRDHIVPIVRCELVQSHGRKTTGQVCPFSALRSQPQLAIKMPRRVGSTCKMRKRK